MQYFEMLNLKNRPCRNICHTSDNKFATLLLWRWRWENMLSLLTLLNRLFTLSRLEIKAWPTPYVISNHCRRFQAFFPAFVKRTDNFYRHLWWSIIYMSSSWDLYLTWFPTDVINKDPQWEWNRLVWLGKFYDLFVDVEMLFTCIITIRFWWL